MASLRDLDIDIDLDVNGSDLFRVNEQIDSLIRHIERIQDDIRIDAELDDNDALVELQRLQQQIDSLDRESVDIDIETDFMRTIAEIEALQREINSLDGDDIFVDVDIRAKNRELLALRAQLQMIEAKANGIDVEFDTAGAHAQLALLQAHLLSVSGAGGSSWISKITDFAASFNLAGMIAFVAKLAVIVALLPLVATLSQVLIGVIGTLGVAIGVAAGGLLAFASSLGVVAVGAVGFGALAIKTITELYDENAELSKAQQKLKQTTDSVLKSFESLQRAVQPQMFAAITSGVAVVNQVLNSSDGIVRNATVAFDGLFKSLGKSLQSSDMRLFFEYIERSVAPLTQSIGAGLGFAIRGILNTMTALEPLTDWVARGFENMMRSFSDWTSSLNYSDGMANFMNYVRDNLPKIGSAFGDLTLGIVDFFAAFSGTASDGLTWFADKMEEFANWAANLGENEGFQNMLDKIAENGPKVAEVIGNITDNAITLMAVLGEMDGVWDFLLKLSDPEALNFDGLKDFFSWKTLLFGPLWGALGVFDFSELFDFKGIGKKVIGALAGITIDISKWFGNFSFGDIFGGGTLGKIDWSKIIKPFKWPTSIFSFKWSSFVKPLVWPAIKSVVWSVFIKPLTWGIYVKRVFWATFIKVLRWGQFVSRLLWSTFVKVLRWAQFIGRLIWTTFIKSLRWAQFIGKLVWSTFIKALSWVSFVAKLSWDTFLDFLNWTSFVAKLSWSTFVKVLSWPSAIFSFSWSDFIPKFSWPNISAGDILNKAKGALPGFSSGIGNVPYDMDATIHKGEAVLQASNAETLRSLGVLKGEGRNPTLDLNALNGRGATKLSVSAASGGAQGGAGNVYNVTVNVNGGNSPQETGQSVAKAISDIFANFDENILSRREG